MRRERLIQSFIQDHAAKFHEDGTCLGGHTPENPCLHGPEDALRASLGNAAYVGRAARAWADAMLAVLDGEQRS